MIPICNDLDHLFPPFREKVEKAIAVAGTYGFELFETFRESQRQLEIWKKGRELQNDIWVVVDASEVATKARPGASYHEYGLAIDSVPKMPGMAPKVGRQWTWDDYDLTKPGKQAIPWEKLIKAYVDNGITAGGNWKKFPDLPHGECSYGFKVSELYPILTKEGIEAVWKLVMTKVPKSPSVVPVPIVVPAAIAVPQPVQYPIPMDTETHMAALDASHDEDVQMGFIGKLIRALSLFFSRKQVF